MEVLLAIIITYISINYLFPILDLSFEWLKYLITDCATILQLRSQSRVKEFELKYPEDKPELSPAIGFRMETSESEFDEDEEDSEDKLKNKMGFHN